jgi:hypothetical protein
VRTRVVQSYSKEVQFLPTCCEQRVTYLVIGISDLELESTFIEQRALAGDMNDALDSSWTNLWPAKGPIPHSLPSPRRRLSERDRTRGTSREVLSQSIRTVPHVFWDCFKLVLIFPSDLAYHLVCALLEDYQLRLDALLLRCQNDGRHSTDRRHSPNTTD